METKRKRVCVVGAGVAGLPSIRHAKLYGFDVVCYEAQQFLGGLWRYRPEATEDASVMRSTIMNTSKEMTAYSDFPFPAEAANLPLHTAMYDYLRDYAAHYELEKHIKYGTRVQNIVRSSDYSKTGHWDVTVKDSSDTESTSTFDCVLLCNGHHSKQKWPSPWPGQETFNGRISHGGSYRTADGYENKVVVVVGAGNSGLDVAVEISRVAKQVHLSTRRGQWIRPRCSPGGRPGDADFNTRIKLAATSLIPAQLYRKMIESRFNAHFDHEKYGLKPEHAPFNAHFTTNDEICHRISCGAVKVWRGIERLDCHTVHFVNGTSVADVDEIIVCTGYLMDFSAVEGGNVIKPKPDDLGIFENIFPIGLEHDTLGVIGLTQNAAIISVSEQQARTVLGVLAGTATLPTKEERAVMHAARTAWRRQRYLGHGNGYEIEWIPYMDRLAGWMGCLPPAWYEHLPSDPEMAIHTLCAPIASYFYRLRGPHAWSGARSAILGIEDRIAKATNPRMRGTLYTTKNGSFYLLCICVALISLTGLTFLRILASILI